VIKQNILPKDLIPRTVLFADGQMIMGITEDELQRTV
jgi:hypothetical protein